MLAVSLQCYEEGEETHKKVSMTFMWNWALRMWVTKRWLDVEKKNNFCCQKSHNHTSLPSHSLNSPFSVGFSSKHVWMICLQFLMWTFSGCCWHVEVVSGRKNDDKYFFTTLEHAHMFHIVCYHNFLQPPFPHTCLLNIQVIILKLKSRAGHSVCMNQVRVVDLIYTHTRGRLCAWNWIFLILIFFIVIVASTTDVRRECTAGKAFKNHFKSSIKEMRSNALKISFNCNTCCYEPLWL